MAPSTFTAVLALYTLIQTVASQSAVLQEYSKSVWRDQRGCQDLQLNFTASTIVTDKNIHFFANINNIDNLTNIEFEIEILVGTIPLSTAFTTSSYEIEWRASPNFAYEDYFLSGDASKITFQGQYREKLNVAGIGTNLVTFTPDSWDLEVIEWPSVLAEKSLPSASKALINVPEIGMAYTAGPLPSTDIDYDTELFAYNYTSGVFTRHKAPNKKWSSVSYIPAGKMGMLVMVAGVERSTLTTPIPLDEIHVYDIANDKWYQQPTTGRTPPDRKRSCAVVTSSSDYLTHQIHLYGGTRPEDMDYVELIDDYWILSVPQFVWTKGPNLPKPRSEASCNLLGNHRMLISAGYVDSSCVDLVQIVDLNTGNITEEFGTDDSSPYQIPGYVLDNIGGNANGQPTVKASFVGGLETAWGTPGDYIWKDLVGTKNNTTDNQDNTTEPPKTTPIGAIVGGVVGGVGAGVLLIGGFFLIRRRRRQRNAAAAAAAALAPPTTEVRDAGPYDPAAHGGIYDPTHRDSVYSTAPPHYGSKSPVPAYSNTFPQMDETPVEVDGTSSAAVELPGNESHNR